ncbi:MAG: hypothetical protein SNJ82_14115, partial [Gemmataceae bacterium]
MNCTLLGSWCQVDLLFLPILLPSTAQRTLLAPMTTRRCLPLPWQLSRSISNYQFLTIVGITLEIGYGLITLVDEAQGAPLMSRITG